MARELKYLCKECRNIFVVSSQNSLENRIPEHCPQCDSDQVMEAPIWAPLGAGFNIFENSTWKYECQQCQHTFELPIPRSPSEEQGRKCLLCGCGHLHLLTKLGAQPLYCG